MRPNWTKDYRNVCGERAELEAFARDGVAGTASLCGRCLGPPGPRRSLSGMRVRLTLAFRFPRSHVNLVAN